MAYGAPGAHTTQYRKAWDADSVLQAKVCNTAYLSQDLKIHLESVSTNIPIEVRQTSAEAALERYTPGQTLWCSWHEKEACVLAH